MPSLLSNSELLEHVKGALMECYKAVVGKGAEARAKVETDIDIRTVGDLAAKQAFIDYFRASKLPLALYTEELEKPVMFSPEPAYSAVGDEIDGTYNFHRGMGMLPCGSIIGISASKNPTFGDFLCCGFLEFNSGNLFYAIKGKGAYAIEGWAKNGSASRKLTTSGKKNLGEVEKVLLDFYMLSGLSRLFVPFGREIGDYGSFAAHLALIANGSADLFIGADNCTNLRKRKTGEELGPLYLLVKEAGGAVLDWNGNDLGPEEVGLDRKKAFHAIAAATEELGKELVAKIRKIREIEPYMHSKGLQ